MENKKNRLIEWISRIILGTLILAVIVLGEKWIPNYYGDYIYWDATILGFIITAFFVDVFTKYQNRVAGIDLLIASYLILKIVTSILKISDNSVNYFSWHYYATISILLMITIVLVYSFIKNRKYLYK